MSQAFDRGALMVVWGAAASIFMAGRNMESAALIYKDLGDYPGASEAYVRAHQYYYEKGHGDKAAEALQKAAKCVPQCGCSGHAVVRCPSLSCGCVWACMGVCACVRVCVCE